MGMTVSLITILTYLKEDDASKSKGRTIATVSNLEKVISQHQNMAYEIDSITNTTRKETNHSFPKVEFQREKAAELIKLSLNNTVSPK